MLNKSEIYNKYKNGFVSTISISSLALIKNNNNYRLYECPCGQGDHFATRVIDDNSVIGDGFSNVLHCWETGQQWLIILCDNVRRIRKIIKTEEEKYFKLLEQSETKIKKYVSKKKLKEVTAKDLFILHTTHGYDPSVVEGVVGNIPSHIYDEYLLLMEEHKHISRTPKQR